jgi:hypothetical protein
MTPQEIAAKLAEPMDYQLRPKTFYHPDYTGERKKQLKAGSLPDGTKGQFLAYIDARDVANRLDAVLGPENWQDSFEIVEAATHVIKAGLGLRLNGEWIWKYDYGYPNSDQDEEPLKSSSSDALKRAGVKWGIGRFLYEMEAQWLPVDKWGKPLGDSQGTNTPAPATAAPRAATPQASAPARTVAPPCPDCGGPMWDNRAKKASGEFASNRPDFSCKKQNGDPDCRGAIWPPKEHMPGERQREDDGFGSMPIEEEMSGKLPFDE